jgi:hypothetical protein
MTKQNVACTCELQEQHFKEREKKALERCASRIQWYDRYALKAWGYWYALQILAITFGGLTPVLILSSALPKPAQALPAALAALLVSISSIFHSRMDAIRYAHARDLLESERAKYCTRTTREYSVNRNPNEALDAFMQHIEGIAIREATEWRNEHVRDTQPGDQGDQHRPPVEQLGRVEPKSRRLTTHRAIPHVLTERHPTMGQEVR